MECQKKAKIHCGFSFTNFITENENSHKYVVLNTEMSRTHHFLVFTFWKPVARSHLWSNID